MSNQSDDRAQAQAVVAYMVGAILIGTVSAAIAPRLRTHPALGLVVGLMLNEIIQPMLTRDLIQQGI